MLRQTSNRSSHCDTETVLSSSWPTAMPLHRQTQPPPLPIRKPVQVSWDISPLCLGPVLKITNLCRSTSQTTLGEDEPLEGFSLDGHTFDEDDEPLMFSLDGPVVEGEARADSPCNLVLTGLDDLGKGECHRLSDGGDHAASHRPGPELLSAIAQVAADTSRRRLSSDSIQDSPRQWILASSWPAATVPSKRLVPPRAPQLRPAPAPFEVLPLQLPMSTAQLTPTSTPPRRPSPFSLDEALDCEHKDMVGVNVDETDEEECLIFAIDNLQSARRGDEDEDSDFCHLDLAGLVDEGDDDDSDNEFAGLGQDVFPYDEAESDRTTSYSGSPGASLVLMSVLEQVAADSAARTRASGQGP